MGPRDGERFRAAYSEARAKLQAALAKEINPNVREDLQIMIDDATRNIEGSALGDRLLLDWNDTPELVFGGMRTLLQEQTTAEKHSHALARLRRYLVWNPTARLSSPNRWRASPRACRAANGSDRTARKSSTP